MSNVYAALGYFEKTMERRIAMENKQIEKRPGCRLIEENEVLEASGGVLHSQVQDMYFSLNEPIVVKV